MKRNMILKTLAVALIGTAVLEAGAQGIYVNKKNGESIAYPKAVLDRVVPAKVNTSTTETNGVGVVADLQYEKVANMKTARMGHQIFPSGKGFVVVGGHTTNFDLTTTAELYENGKWRDLSISSPHDGAFSVIMSDGRVMVGGGFSSRIGVGHSKKVDIYDPKTQTFTAGPNLSVARAFCKAVAVGKHVYVNGNWWSDGDATKMDYYDGKSFNSISGMHERNNPYMFATSNGKIWTWGTYDKSGKQAVFDKVEGKDAYQFNEYLESTGKVDDYVFTDLAKYLPLGLTADVRPSDSYESSLDSYFFLTQTSTGDYVLYRTRVAEDGMSRYKFDIPEVFPGTKTAITYRGGVIVNEKKSELYLIGCSGTNTKQTVYIVSYNYSKGYWTIASAGGFGYNLMEGSWTLLADGRLACAGGNIKDNYDAQKGVYIFTPPTAGAASASSSKEYGVHVYKTDGSFETYTDSELESITTYEEEFDERIAQEIPVEYLSKMSAYTPIYSGSTPPSIEGTYLMSPCLMVYNSDLNSSYKPGKIFNDYIAKYSNQNMTKNTAIYQYEERYNGSVTSKSDEAEARVLGEGNNYTAYTIVETTHTDGSWTKMATILSATMTAEGLGNFYYGILMLDKKDPNNNKMNIGVFRIFKDEDGLSEPTTWQARMRDARVGLDERAAYLDPTAKAPAGEAQIEDIVKKSKQD